MDIEDFLTNKSGDEERTPIFSVRRLNRHIAELGETEMEVKKGFQDLRRIMRPEIIDGSEKSFERGLEIASSLSVERILRKSLKEVRQTTQPVSQGCNCLW